MASKNMLLRLDDELAERVRALAEIEGRSVSDVIREAIGDHVDRRRRDPEFRRRLQDSLRRHEELLRLLAEDQ